MKSFQQYFKEQFDLCDTTTGKHCAERVATENMLNDLAKNQEELDNDNDLLRGEIMEIHKRNDEQNKQIEWLTLEDKFRKEEIKQLRGFDN